MNRPPEFLRTFEDGTRIIRDPQPPYDLRVCAPWGQQWGLEAWAMLPADHPIAIAAMKRHKEGVGTR